MPARRIVLRFYPRKGYWHGTSIVKGRVYSVRGHNPNHVFNELRTLLRTPADQWRVSDSAANLFVCDEVPPVQEASQPGSTADFPCLDA